MKLDFKREMKHLYGPGAKEVVQVDVPSMNFLMVDGIGDPGTAQTYGEAIEALYGLAYALKFAVKKGSSAIDYGVMPLEGLWWADDMSAFAEGDRSAWKWTMMIMQPEFVTWELVDEAAEKLAGKKNPVALPLVRFESFCEGAAAQIMHIGPFSEEGPTIQRVHEFIDDSGCERFGKHHEIYLSDIRRADPAKWKTVIRQPMR
ncbi:MAG: GyrI-like domain-containing protein [Actinomycetota bacterium]|jgi:hypothetical protein|nr:GyrI-like domain-containing protein [Actinomycetota bacterium]